MTASEPRVSISTSSGGAPRNHPPSSALLSRRLAQLCSRRRIAYRSASSIGPIWTYTLSADCDETCTVDLPSSWPKMPVPPHFQCRWRRDDAAIAVLAWRLAARAPSSGLRAARADRAEPPSRRPATPSPQTAPALSRQQKTVHAETRTAADGAPAARAQDGQGLAASPPPPDVWSAAEIDDAKARCTAALKGLDADVTSEAPIKEGRVRHPGAHPPVAPRQASPSRPPRSSIAACWRRSIPGSPRTCSRRPQRQLGAKITKIEVMSDYSCRTAFGRVGSKLSQHAYVDALDIRGFVTDKGEDGRRARTAGAPPTATSPQPQRRQGQGRAARASAGTTPRTPSATTCATASPAIGEAPAPDADGLIARHAGQRHRQGDALAAASTRSPSFCPAAARSRQRLPPRRPRRQGARRRRQESRKPLTGTEQTAAISPDLLAAPPTGPRARFLREAHAAACRIFGTTLGPEANEAHRNHFHVDMAERKVKKICD